MKKNKQKNNDATKEGYVRVQQVIKNGKGQETIVSKLIPEHLSLKPKLMQRMGIILEGDKAFVSKEQIEQEKSEYQAWADAIDKVEILQGLLPIEKVPFKIEILTERIKQLSKKEPSKKEPIKPE